MSVLPPNHLPNEIGTIPQKHVGTGNENVLDVPVEYTMDLLVQLSSSEYSHARPSAHPQPTTTTTMITNPTSAASNLQIRAQNYPRNQGPVCHRRTQLSIGCVYYPISVSADYVDNSRSSTTTSILAQVSTDTVGETCTNEPTASSDDISTSRSSESRSSKNDNGIHSTRNAFIAESIH